MRLIDGAIEGFVAHQRAGDAVAWKAHGDTHRALGGNIQIIGSPEHVVDKLVGLKRPAATGSRSPSSISRPILSSSAKLCCR